MADTKPRGVLGIVFLIVFLDIVGFSILFPLFPGMMDHYLAREGSQSLVGRIHAQLAEVAADDENAVATLFGAVLGSLYGLLQFVFAPIWGALSDRIGRRPTLVVTLAGTVASYAFWVFANSFGLFVLSRALAGIMAGNISTASAAAADASEGRDRAKAMGIVGMAIGLGFVLGPAIGGISGSVRIGDAGGGALGLHPFSVPALCALGLAMLNLAWVATRFGETLPPVARKDGASWNPLARLRSLDLPGIPRTNLVYLLYLTAFAAMEFTLTFLAAERLGWDHRELTWMFVYTGFVIAFVQGGLVRRMVPRLGERKVTLQGLAAIVPGFVVIALAGSGLVLYLGITLMAVGSALAMPSLSALASRYAPASSQGLALGTLRSMGSLARAVGPVLGGVCYWRFGSAAPYWAGAVFLVLPIALVLGLPPVPSEEAAPASSPAPEGGS